MFVHAITLNGLIVFTGVHAPALSHIHIYTFNLFHFAHLVFAVADITYMLYFHLPVPKLHLPVPKLQS